MPVCFFLTDGHSITYDGEPKATCRRSDCFGYSRTRRRAVRHPFRNLHPSRVANALRRLDGFSHHCGLGQSGFPDWPNPKLQANGDSWSPVVESLPLAAVASTCRHSMAAGAMAERRRSRSGGVYLISSRREAVPAIEGTPFPRTGLRRRTPTGAQKELRSPL
jgi:hypothetical protein